MTDHHYKAFLNKLLCILSANIATVLCGLHEVCHKGQFNLEGISYCLTLFVVLSRANNGWIIEYMSRDEN